jgi:hypothetical protein
MGVSVEVHDWPVIELAPGQMITLIHWIRSGGQSLIQPGRWYWMSAVPEYITSHPDRPIPGAELVAVSQGPVRAWAEHAGSSNTDWRVTWHNTGRDFIRFRPQLLQAPAP